MIVGADARLIWTAYGAAASAGLSAVLSAYWLAGGTWLLSTVGGAVEEQGRGGGAAVTLALALVVGLKLLAGLLAVALAHPPAGQRLRRLLVPAALFGGGLLTLYGGALVAAGAVALTGVLGEPADPTALRWHVFLWDAWFLLWGLLLLGAAVQRRRLDRAVKARIS